MSTRSYTNPVSQKMIYHSEFEDSYKTVLYEINTVKGEYKTIPEIVEIVDKADPNHLMYKDPGAYAFGILIDPFNTKLLVFDMDCLADTDAYKVARAFQHKGVVGIDLFRSSTNGHHLHIALDGYYNVTSYYSHPFDIMCSGFCSIAKNRNQAVLRISPKITLHALGSMEYGSHIMPLCAWRLINNKWETYFLLSSPFPEPSPVAKIKEKRKRTINLRT